jgi:hypothetical protein
MQFGETHHAVWGDAPCSLGRRTMQFGETIFALNARKHLPYQTLDCIRLF